MTSRKTVMVAGVLAGLAAGALLPVARPAAATAPAAETQAAENPEFRAWAGHKVGTRVTMEASYTPLSRRGPNGQVIQTVRAPVTMIEELVERHDDAVVIEMTRAAAMNGAVQSLNTSRFTIPAKLAGPATLPGVGAPADNVVVTGKDTLTIGEKKIEAVTREITHEKGMVTRTWMAEDFPGQVLRLEDYQAQGQTPQSVYRVTEFVEGNGTASGGGASAASGPAK
jgi:hypothetical protein